MSQTAVYPILLFLKKSFINFISFYEILHTLDTFLLYHKFQIDGQHLLFKLSPPS